MKKTVAPVCIKKQPSALLMAVLLLGHGFAAMLVCLLSLSLVAKLALISLLLVMAVRESPWASGRRFSSSWAVTELLLKPDGGVDVLFLDGRCVTSEVSGQTVVCSFLVILVLRLHDSDVRNRRVVRLSLLPDGVGKEMHRQLRIWLKHHARLPGVGVVRDGSGGVVQP